MNNKLLVPVVIIIAIIAGIALYNYFIPAEADLEEKKDEEPKTMYEACMANQQDKNECLAYQTNDASLCGDIPGRSDWCRAAIEKDPSHCDFEGDNIHCYVDSAESAEDCYEIDVGDEPDELDECLAFVTKNESYCDGMSEGMKWACLGRVHDDPSYCRKSPHFGLKWHCLFLTSDDPELCDEYHQELCEYSFK
ncbi:hypothetical protein GF323_02310 [Candidatus Woesearchaeota archaeon]|nr:hypothetical protein [Candidatus Woesearchaeota archaeon]